MRKVLNIALDCDGLVSNFAQGVIKRANEMGLGEHFPTSWEEVECWKISDKFSEVMANAWTDPEFWLNLPVMPNSELSFTPRAYITSRPVPSSVTEEWLLKNGFPKAEVITVDRPEKKLMYLKQLGVALFVDDLHTTVIQCRKAGINCLLYKAPYHRSVQLECLDLPVIENLEEVYQYYG